MNFRNSEPPANFKTARISALTDGTETNNLMGSDLVSEASAFLKEANNSFDSLAEMNGNMDSYNGDFDDTIQKNQVIRQRKLSIQGQRKWDNCFLLNAQVSES